MSEPFIGEIRMFTYTFAPWCWAYCNGQLLPTAQNPALFAIIGSTFGGDWRTTMGMPNLAGRAPLHVGGSQNQGPGLSPHSLGQGGGVPGVTLAAANLPAHDHHLKATKTEPENNEPAHQVTAKHRDNSLGKLYKNNPGTLDAHFATETVGPSGNMAGQPHENRQPYLATPFCMALMGQFPSRS